MKVVLLKGVKGLGHAGDIKEVAEGHARNFLLPQKLAVLATSEALARIEKLAKTKEKKEQEKVKDTKDLEKKLRGLLLEIKVKADETGTLYKSVGQKELIKELANKDLVLEEKRIKLDGPFKKIGEYEVLVDLGDGKEVKFKINIKSE